MIDFVKKRRYYYIFSGILILASLILLAVGGLKFSIDFIGGSEFTLSGDTQRVEEILKEEKINVFSSLETQNGKVYRIQEISQDTREKVENRFKEQGKIKVEQFQTIGPVIGEETKSKAIQAVILAIVAILIYIAITFRHVSRPVSSWKFGIAAVVALIHDVLTTLGVFAFLGLVWGVEVDPLFITAVLTIMGFSVHDTIVTFDRIRENLRNNINNTPFPTIVNNSIIETLTRSVNTSMTVLFVLVALLLFGGGSIRWFTVALTVGVVVGVYSSIFVASQLLVTWYEFDKKRNKKEDNKKKSS